MISYYKVILKSYQQSYREKFLISLLAHLHFLFIPMLGLYFFYFISITFFFTKKIIYEDQHGSPETPFFLNLPQNQRTA